MKVKYELLITRKGVYYPGKICATQEEAMKRAHEHAKGERLYWFGFQSKGLLVWTNDPTIKGYTYAVREVLT